jgi:hypothetical protein
MNVFRSIPTGVLQCTHSSTISELLPPESTHYGKLKCGNCGAFLKFLPRPENEQRRIINGYRLAKLQMCAGLNSWEREFIQSLRNREAISCRRSNRLCLIAFALPTLKKGGQANERENISGNFCDGY